jgi:hypothetical protein
LIAAVTVKEGHGWIGCCMSRGRDSALEGSDGSRLSRKAN